MRTLLFRPQSRFQNITSLQKLYNCMHSCSFRIQSGGKLCIHHHHHHHEEQSVLSSRQQLKQPYLCGSSSKLVRVAYNNKNNHFKLTFIVVITSDSFRSPIPPLPKLSTLLTKYCFEQFGFSHLTFALFFTYNYPMAL